MEQEKESGITTRAPLSSRVQSVHCSPVVKRRAESWPCCDDNRSSPRSPGYKRADIKAANTVKDDSGRKEKKHLWANKVTVQP